TYYIYNLKYLYVFILIIDYWGCKKYIGQFGNMKNKTNLGVRTLVSRFVFLLNKLKNSDLFKTCMGNAKR
ncbi:hypothetical protein, partial [Xanthovirga aplysinae]|uniref:hypothetical protein n=1 Tax=Xanthovirga aplysinae TaxID=2529853 RepID=UPI001CA3EF84